MADTLAVSQALGALALQAIDVLDNYVDGRAAIGDAMLLVEVRLLDEEGDQIATATHYFATTRRSIVQRGLLESCRAGYVEGDEADIDDCLGEVDEDD
jgi:hypothetical protein